jgi:hypothetical protein
MSPPPDEPLAPRDSSSALAGARPAAPQDERPVITPKAVIETTPIVIEHYKQRDRVAASVLAVPYKRADGETK